MTTFRQDAGRQDAGPAAPSAGALLEAYRAVRRFSLWLCEPLEVEDYVVQSMPEASPIKWHLGHTTWFFEQFVLQAARAAYRPFDARFGLLFNSYYHSVGPQWGRGQRGQLSRPSVEEIRRYRAHVDHHVEALLEADALDGRLCAVLEVGLHHEQQHQELMLTDIKHAFFVNPLRPAYCPSPPPVSAVEGASVASDAPPEPEWFEYAGGVYRIGHTREAGGEAGFAFDNERPRHAVFLEPFALAGRPVSAGEFAAFIDDGGYDEPRWWMSEGWDQVCQHGWEAPLYWERDGDGRLWQMTLAGMQPLDPGAPVCHVSYFEADAYARWAGARLPTEAEWEVVAQLCEISGNFVEQAYFHPVALPAAGRPRSHPAGLFGDVWEWTSSPYVAYPGHRPWDDALGEYNAKFMCNQLVLRGGSCVTSRDHVRATYRNFFAAPTRWQFAGFRLAR